MEEFLDKLLTFVYKETDWKECNDTTNSQVINEFLSRNEDLVNKLIDELCDGITSIEESVLPIYDASNRRELLCAFFKFFRDNGEANIGMSIEQFVDAFLSTQ